MHTSVSTNFFKTYYTQFNIHIMSFKQCLGFAFKNWDEEFCNIMLERTEGQKCVARTVATYVLKTKYNVEK